MALGKLPNKQRLYADVKPSQSIDEAYYKKYIKIIHLRVDQAGIRLAGELNRMLGNNKIQIAITDTATPQQIAAATIQSRKIKLEDVKKNVDNDMIVSGRVYGSKDIKSMVLVNIDAAYPNQLLTVILKGDAKKLADQIANKTITVQGKLINFKGRAEIVVMDSKAIDINK